MSKSGLLKKLKSLQLSNLLQSILRVGLLKLISIPIGFLLSIVLARILGVQGFGQFSFIMALVPLLSLPITGGAPILLTREIAKYNHLKQWGLYKGIIASAFKWVTVFSVVVIATTYAVSHLDVIQRSVNPTHLILGTLILPILGYNAIRFSVFTGLGFPSITEATRQIALPLLIVLLVVVHHRYGQVTVSSALVAHVVGGLIIFAVTFFLYRRTAPHEARQVAGEYHYRPWLASLLPLTLIVLASTFNAQIGIVLLGIMGTDEGVAGLRVAEKAAQFVIIALNVINMVAGPYMVRSYQDNDTASLQALSHKAARGAFLCAVPLGLLLIVFGKPIIGLAFGDDYVDIAYLPLAILVAGQMFNAACGSVGHMLAMSGHESSILVGQFSGVVVTIALCLFLIPPYGAVGAAMSVSAGLITWNVLLAGYVVKRLNIRPGIF